MGQPDEWCFVQVLQAVNSAVHAHAPNVQNPHSILSQVPVRSKWFSVVDLANAFFSIPVHKDSLYWFAFSFKGKTYTWIRLPQGYCEFPAIFTVALKENLEGLKLPAGSTILVYISDIMICSPTKWACERNTTVLLQYLAANGHKTSLGKLQWVQQKVTFLGHVITEEGKILS